MAVNPDFKDLFKIFNKHHVEYLVVGAYAVIYYTIPRYTKDLDIWINPTSENADKVWSALEEFGAPLIDISRKDFTDEDLIYQIGIEPNRIDIIMGICGVRFPEAWREREESTFGGIPIVIIGRRHLIQSKRSANRPQDLIDVENLERK